jgi:hypothetical protein
MADLTPELARKIASLLVDDAMRGPRPVAWLAEMIEEAEDQLAEGPYADAFLEVLRAAVRSLS